MTANAVGRLPMRLGPEVGLITINLHALQLVSAQAADSIHSYCLQQVLLVSQARSLRLTGGLMLLLLLFIIMHENYYRGI